MTRQALTKVVIALGAFALLATALVLVRSLLPNKRTQNLAVLLDTQLPAPGTFQQLDFDRTRILLISAPTGEVAVFRLPLRNGKVVLPDIHWWRHPYDCADFRPETHDGTLNASSTFECHDPNMPDWSGISWRWSIDGRNIRSPRDVPVDDLVVADFEQRGNHVRLYRKHVPW